MTNFIRPILKQRALPYLSIARSTTPSIMRINPFIHQQRFHAEDPDGRPEPDDEYKYSCARRFDLADMNTKFAEQGGKMAAAKDGH